MSAPNLPVIDMGYVATKRPDLQRAAKSYMDSRRISCYDPNEWQRSETLFGRLMEAYSSPTIAS